MSTPASFPQYAKMHQQLGEPTSEQLQWLLASGLLGDLGAAAGPHLAQVDRKAFRALLAPKPSEIAWTPVGLYAAKLRDWNRRFQLGLSDQQIDDLAAKLSNHAGLLRPSSISLTLGKGLQHDWEVVMQILEYEVEKLGVPFRQYLDASRLSYLPGSEPDKAKTPQLGVALLDLQTFWDPQNGVVPREARRQRSRWPGLEVAWLLALNPEVYVAMDGETVPFVWATGLVVDSGDLPCFLRNSGEAFVSDRWGAYGEWCNYSVAAFREC